MNETLSVAIPCRADEPGLAATLESLSVACQHRALPAGVVGELVICINGVDKGTVSAPTTAVHNFCHRHRVAVEEMWIEPSGSSHPVPLPYGTREPILAKSPITLQDRGGVSLSPFLPFSVSPFPRCTVLLTERRGKPPAWNMLWRWTNSELVLFSDADVQVDAAAVYHLWARCQQDPGLQLVAAREVPVLKNGGTLWSRMGAIPYRFNFGNAGGRLLLLRKEALPNGMPEDLLLEDAWLTVAVGRQRVAKELQARVFFLPPATGRDYFAERVRTEGGKLQIRRLYKELLSAGPIAQYRWSQCWREIHLTEYPLVILAFLVRGFACLWARVALTRKDFYALYRPFTSTKAWESPSA